MIYKALHIGEVFGYPLLNSWKRAESIQETPCLCFQTLCSLFQICKAFFFKDISIHHPKQPMKEARQTAFCFFSHFTDEKKWKPRDSKTYVVTQGLVFRRALCLVSYSIATFLKVLGYESGALHFHFVLDPKSDEGSPAGSVCFAHTHGQIELVPLRRFECFLMWNLLFLLLHLRQIWDL